MTTAEAIDAAGQRGPRAASPSLLRHLIPIVWRCFQEKKKAVHDTADRVIAARSRTGSIAPPMLPTRLLDLVAAYGEVLALIERRRKGVELCRALAHVRQCERKARAEQRRFSDAIGKMKGARGPGRSLADLELSR